MSFLLNLNELSSMVKNIGDEAVIVIDKSWVFMSFCLDCVFLNIGLVFNANPSTMVVFPTPLSPRRMGYFWFCGKVSE